MTQTDVRVKSVQANKAKCFLKLLQDKSVILYAHLLLDVTEELKKLSFLFQERESSLADIHRSLTGSLAVIRKMKTRFVACIMLLTIILLNDK